MSSAKWQPFFPGGDESMIKWQDILWSELAMSWSHEKWIEIFPITLKFDRPLINAVAMLPVKFKLLSNFSDLLIAITNLVDFCRQHCSCFWLNRYQTICIPAYGSTDARLSVFLLMAQQILDYLRSCLWLNTRPSAFLLMAQQILDYLHSCLWLNTRLSAFLFMAQQILDYLRSCLWLNTRLSAFLFMAQQIPDYLHSCLWLNRYQTICIPAYGSTDTRLSAFLLMAQY